MPKAVTISKASSGRAASVIKQRTRKQKSVPGSSTQNPSTGVLAPTASKVTKRKGKVAPQPAARASKRGKRKETQSSTDVVDLTGEGGDNVKPPRTLPNKSKAKARKDDSEEKRMKRFRQQPSSSFRERMARVTSQRMFVIDRSGRGDENSLEETFQMAGTTGNVYRVRICHVPTCTCPDSRVKRNQCKHIIYVLVNVLKAPEHLQYQAAFLSSELQQLFANAPAPPEAHASDHDHSGLRKPVEGDCPICVLEFRPDKEEIVFCRSGCGNNIHAECFKRWAATKHGDVTCVFCRTPWPVDEESISKTSLSGPVNAEGYVNVASELGLSGRRDTSSYHQPWVYRTYGYGY